MCFLCIFLTGQPCKDRLILPLFLKEKHIDYKLTPERTVRFVKKIIQKHKKRATKDKKKLNNLLKMHNSEAEPILKEEVDAEFNNTLERVERAKFRFDESLTALHSLLGESLEKIHAKNASCFSGTSTVQTRRGVIEITSKT